MSKGVITPRGLKYTLSDEVFYAVMEKDANTNMLWDEINAAIEYAELFPTFLSFGVFCAAACRSSSAAPWHMPAVYAFIAHGLGTIVSNWAFFFTDNLLLRIIMSVFQLFSRFFLHYAAAVALALAVVHDWRLAVLYILGSLVLSFVITMSVGGYRQREPFNDRVARSVLQK